MFPTLLPSLALHGAALLVRRHGGVLLWRIVLEMVSAGVLGWALLNAWDRVAATPQDPRAWAAALAFALAGLALYIMLRVITRAGTVRVLQARLRGTNERGVVVEGATVFPDAFSSSLYLFGLDGLWMGCVVIELMLAERVAAHGTWAAAVAALCVSATICIGLAASAFGSFAYVLGLLDGCDVVEAWPRLRNVLGSTDAETRTRFVRLALLLFALGTVLGWVDLLSSVSAQVDDLGNTPVLLMVAPLVLAFVACVLDVAMLLFLAALTDRLPLGMAARVALVDPRHG